MDKCKHENTIFDKFPGQRRFEYCLDCKQSRLEWHVHETIWDDDKRKTFVMDMKSQLKTAKERVRHETNANGFLKGRIDGLNALLKEYEWVNVIEDNSWDIRCVDVPTGGDDCDIHWIVIEHYMADPKEREIGRGSSPREAFESVPTHPKPVEERVECIWIRPCGTCHNLGSINRGGPCSKQCKAFEPIEGKD